eukprot:TRINITY_DN28582_c2_g1_i1.p1 TRINITY_DN28582_c2_g1~~TRINITY_DN28582_c2_g1_i1.p1  ORF type:complete len:458 (-),score=78.68 TRINITY_DN28582_c2_g1_i1:157-1488(-)
METLCSVFDTVCCINEFFERSDSIDQELTNLQATVESIAQSVRAFAAELRPEEKEEVFHSNTVWQQILKQLQECEQVISKQCRESLRDKEDCSQKQIADSAGESARSIISRWRKSVTRTVTTSFNDGLEVVSGKLGSVGTRVLRLPEDKLGIIRQSSTELTRLVPLLQLAISARSSSAGRKRSYEEIAQINIAQPKMLRGGFTTHEMSSGEHYPDAAVSRDVPSIDLALTSESPKAKGIKLPVLSTRHLRIAMVSSSSLDGNPASGKDDDAPLRLAFGRQDLVNKVPREITVCGFDRAAGTMVTRPIIAGVSRNHLVLQVLPRPTAAAAAGNGTLTAPTLDFGEDADATLSWGNAPGDDPLLASPSRTLAHARGQLHLGIHVRSKGEILWRWFAKDVQADIHEGDCLALLMESPPDSGEPGEKRDLSETEARCLLGLVFTAAT